MKIVVTTFNRRSFDVWEPMLRGLAACGVEVETLWFPRLVDPDHARLYDAPFRNLLAEPIDRAGEPIDGDWAGLSSRVAAAVTQASPDLILCCTPNLGPESRLRSMLDATRRPPVFGLQHGFVQWWPFYETVCDLDGFGVFGPPFIDRMPTLPRSRVTPLAMPKLDRLKPAPGGEDLLFIGQERPGAEELGALLSALAERTGLRPVVRPHPEHRDVYARLSDRFAFSVGEPVEAAIARAGAVISTGSTSVLEALVMETPVVVLPMQEGEEYAALPIVSDGLDPDQIARLLNRQSKRKFAEARAAFLEDHTGSARPERAFLAAKRLFKALGLPTRDLSAKAFAPTADPASKIRMTDTPTAMNDTVRTLAALATAEARLEDVARELEVTRLRARGAQDQLVEAQGREAQLRGSLDALQAERDAARENAARLAAAPSPDRAAAVAAMEDDLRRARVKVAGATAARDASIEAAAALQADLRAAVQQTAQAQAERDASTQAATRAQTELMDLLAEIETLAGAGRRGDNAPALARLAGRLAGLEDDLRSRRSDSDALSALRVRADQTETALIALKVALDERQDALKRALYERDRLRDEQADHQAAADALTARIADLEAQVADRDAAAADGRARAMALQVELEEVRRAGDEAIVRAEQLTGELAQAQARYEALPWRVIQTYRRARRRTPAGLWTFLARFVRRRPPTA